MDTTNRLKLVRALEAEGIRSSAYSVNGAEDMALCLDKISDSNWEVFYFERGGKTFSRTFSTETDACQFMYSELASDKTSRMI